MKPKYKVGDKKVFVSKWSTRSRTLHFCNDDNKDCVHISFEFERSFNDGDLIVAKFRKTISGVQMWQACEEEDQ